MRWPIEAAVRSGYAGSVAGAPPGASADTLAEKGWSDKENDEFLDVAEREQYEVLVTTDQSLPYQQNLPGRRIGLVVLLSTDWREVRLRTREIGEAIAAVGAGKVIEVPIRVK